MSASNTRADSQAIPRSVRWVAWTFFTVNVLAVVWPGLKFFNRVEPMIFGLPFIMVWLAGWLVATLVVLTWIEHRLHGLGGEIDRQPPGMADSGIDD